MHGLGHIAENGIRHFIHFVTYREERMLSIALVLCKLEIAVFTGLEMKESVIKAKHGPLITAIAGITKHLGKDHIVLNGTLGTLICHIVSYPEEIM